MDRFSSLRLFNRVVAPMMPAGGSAILNTSIQGSQGTPG
jgi:hypothetical protein